MPDDIPRSILLLILLVLGGGFFAGSETAFSYCNHLHMKRYAEDGSAAAKRVLRILEKFDKLLTTILIGTNVCYTTASSLATVIAVELLGTTTGPVVATAIVTVSVFFFAETLPKNISRANADRVSRAVSLPMHVMMTLLTPVSIFFSGIGKLCTALLGAKNDPTMTEDEFAAVVEDVEEDGLLEPEESALIQSAIEFADSTAADIMVPAAQMVGIEVSELQESIRQKLLSEKYSRLPLYRGSPETVIGVLRSKALLYALLDGQKLELTQFMIPPYFVAPETKLDALFEGLGRRRTHIAFVLGENGVQGFVTMEDILEELVGEIYDEDDAAVDGAKGGAAL